ncbi:4-diphosphocytidyl-2C-methyl-D-erythritol synthase [Flagellimonas aquimarina]|jgi:molybdenum cofactor cytidylyltransferase|uniref:4-diphosphocytidyl-2C-methyl-D-erythritol synthase n=1 Tax=Flagellimonas aquimarina TaxID=2201895 RepID=A0A316L3V2_9FLAO|nr:nucleotidyltransferase family protein [Allomuricauda koreensis]PWL38923.1 4-diphosphocytidyl-2C-methyl-D-erythritol synthase [Allomuricauda koreensis]
MSDGISTLILAAGASKRMGNKVKQLLPWGNSTLIENTVATAKQVSDSVFIVLGANREKIRESTSLDAEIIHNPNWKAGMGSSISIGAEYILKHAEGKNGLLIMLADQPLIDASYLNQLKKEFDQDDFKVVATSYENRLGVPAIFHQSIIPELTHLNGDYGARHIIKKYQATIKSVLPNGKELDIDTPETYSQLIDNMNF